MVGVGKKGGVWLTLAVVANLRELVRHGIGPVYALAYVTGRCSEGSTYTSNAAALDWRA